MIRLRSAAVLAAAALALAACGSGSGSENKPAASNEPRTLKLWHYETADSAMGKAWAEAIKKFQATHPGVT
ncbi:MAG: carbohydrate ABC transporter substrate-binding protein, partial [Nonomuraea sp.]|nr:carbohydrate ABC transporter substrate-binding protein [Nonomuraea sp.]